MKTLSLPRPTWPSPSHSDYWRCLLSIIIPSLILFLPSAASGFTGCRITLLTAFLSFNYDAVLKIEKFQIVYFFFSSNTTLLDAKTLCPHSALGARSTHAFNLSSKASQEPGMFHHLAEDQSPHRRSISSMKSSQIYQRPAAT